MVQWSLNEGSDFQARNRRLLIGLVTTLSFFDLWRYYCCSLPVTSPNTFLTKCSTSLSLSLPLFSMPSPQIYLLLVLNGSFDHSVCLYFTTCCFHEWAPELENTPQEWGLTWRYQNLNVSVLRQQRYFSHRLEIQLRAIYIFCNGVIWSLIPFSSGLGWPYWLTSHQKNGAGRIQFLRQGPKIPSSFLLSSWDAWSISRHSVSKGSLSRPPRRIQSLCFEDSSYTGHV